ncbi:MAG: flagellar protein FlaG [Treponema sp.]|nr:flagellar protein FlaG [Treponema sp.]
MSVATLGYFVPGQIPVSSTPISDSRGQQVRPEIKTNPHTAQILREQQKKLEQQTQIVDLERIGQAFNKKLQFVVDHTSNEVIVKVIDKETDKVIKVIPPEELQRLHRNLKETIGLLLDEMV